MPSSVIASFYFNADTKTLQIKFVSGLTYLYYHVPSSVYEAFAHAKSKGSYFNRYIRDQYIFKKQK